MEEESQRKGFTIVEVSLVLAISGLILIGVINGVSGSVARQRYNDSVQSVTEDLRRAYTDAANPQGLSDSGGKSNTLIYGKLVVVKASAIEVSTVTGNMNHSDETLDLISTIISVNPKINTESTKTYTLPWSAKIQKKDGNNFKGSFLIVYSPNGGAIHTFYRNAVVTDLEEATLKNFKTNEAANLCIDSPDLYAAGGIRRNIRIAPDGRNSSAVQLIDVNSEDNKC